MPAVGVCGGLTVVGGSRRPRGHGFPADLCVCVPRAAEQPKGEDTPAGLPQALEGDREP